MRRIGCLGLAVVAAVLVAAFFVVQAWGGDGPLDRNRSFVVPEGATLSGAAAQLEEAGAITSARRFLLLTRLFGSDDPIRAGEYRLPAGISPSDILQLFQGGRTLQRFVTIPEGMPSVLVREQLLAAPLLTGDVAVPAEGSVLPDSYSYGRGESRQAVLERMQAGMRDELARLWADRKPSSVVTTPQQAVTLASIVEKETGKPAERRMVASVYSNRLRQGMKLDADPTVIYPITKGRPLGRRIRRSELDAVNGYNTYASRGLPVGPIANPGRESIAAVLDPAESSALYFVADGTGGHVFADTLAEHNANVQRWYALRRARGEM